MLSSGGVECRGNNAYGQFGIGSTGGPDGEAGYDVAQEVTGITNAVSVTTDGGGLGYCAVLATGRVDCWGDNSYGELGIGIMNGPDGPYHQDYDSPQTVSGVTTADSVASEGDSYGYGAVLEAGGVDCWGYNNYGQVGNGTVNGAIDGPDYYGYDTPQPVTGIANSDSVSNDGVNGYDSFCAVLKTGPVECWGYNSNGELGNGAPGGPDTVGGYDAPQAVGSP